MDACNEKFIVMRNMAALDYKAIVAFILVIETRSLARTAMLLSCSQSTISMQLKRFRIMTSTILFTREGRVLQPTTEAVQLAMSLKQTITQLNEMIIKE